MRKKLLMISIIGVLVLTSVSVWAEQTLVITPTPDAIGDNVEEGLVNEASQEEENTNLLIELSLSDAISQALESNANIQLLQYELEKQELSNREAGVSFDYGVADGAIQLAIAQGVKAAAEAVIIGRIDNGEIVSRDDLSEDDIKQIEKQVRPGVEAYVFDNKEAIQERAKKEMHESKNELTELMENQTILVRNDYSKAKQEIEFNVNKLYSEGLKTNAFIEIAQTNIERINTQYNQAKSRYDLGLISKRDLLDIEISLAQAETNLIQARAGAETIRLNLNRIMNQPLDSSYQLTTKLDQVTDPSYDLTQDIERALAYNPQVTSAKAQLEMVEYNRDNNTRGHYNYERAKIQVKQLQIQVTEAEENIKMQVQQAYMDIESAYNKYIYLIKAKEQSEESLHLAQLNYDVGLITNYELQGARLGLMTAENDLVTAIYDYQLARLNYEFLVGLVK